MNEEGANLKPQQKKKTYRIILVGLKVLVSALFLALSSIMLYIHNVSSITGSLDYNYDGSAQITSETELLQFVEKYYRDTQYMNITEIGIWIIIPALLIGALIFLWIKKTTLFKGTVTIGVVIFIFGVAQTSNVIGVNSRLESEKPIWKDMFSVIKNEQPEKYQVSRTSGCFEGCGGAVGSVQYITTDKDFAYDLVSNLAEQGFEYQYSETGKFGKYCKGLLEVSVVWGTTVADESLSDDQVKVLAETNFTNNRSC